MAYPKSLLAYTDVRPVLDVALAQRGAKYSLADASAATRWRGRANYYRTLLRREGINQFDELILSQDGASIIITCRAPAGVITTLDDKPVDTQVEDVAMSEARELLAKLRGV